MRRSDGGIETRKFSMANINLRDRSYRAYYYKWRAAVYDGNGFQSVVVETPTAAIWSKKTHDRRTKAVTATTTVPANSRDGRKRTRSHSSLPACNQTLPYSPIETSSPSTASGTGSSWSALSDLSDIDVDREIGEIWSALQYGRYLEAVQKLNDLSPRTRSSVLTWGLGKDRDTLLHKIASEHVSPTDAIAIKQFLLHLKETRPQDFASAIRAKNSRGQTPLTCAIFHNTEHVWRPILNGSIPREDTRAVLRARTNSDSTVIHTAASRDEGHVFLEFFFAGVENGNLGLVAGDVEELLNARCKLPGSRDNTRVTPLEFALKRQKDRAAVVLQRASMHYGVHAQQTALCEHISST
ncbi:hypothetical protein BDZ88DRAFT_489315 [Geranomyces variabilis]|nr:hypothetical protein BDZ88DRAFT_489315 [Geranomyces variabilis]KAJ3135140.1 hypothetical protein HDU90_004172 [Geranomyces variabilis]